MDEQTEDVAVVEEPAEEASDGCDHASGTPCRREFVGGGDDPRDRGLCEVIDSEEKAWEGRIFDVDTLRVTLLDGRPARRDVVRHPGAVALVALTDDGRVCLVRQYRTALDRVTVELPAGKLDPGEDPERCARRELLEETGFEAEKLALLTSIVTSCGFSDELIHIYMATGLTFVGSDPDADEFLNVDLVDTEEFVDAVLDGRVEDAKTVVGALALDAIGRRLGCPLSHHPDTFAPTVGHFCPKPGLTRMCVSPVACVKGDGGFYHMAGPIGAAQPFLISSAALTPTTRRQ